MGTEKRVWVEIAPIANGRSIDNNLQSMAFDVKVSRMLQASRHPEYPSKSSE